MKKKLLKVCTVAAVTVVVGCGFSGTSHASSSWYGQVSSNAVIDLKPIPSKTSQKVLAPDSNKAKTKASLASSNPTDSSEIVLHSPLFGDAYAVATSRSTINEDYIYAKARSYDGSDYLIDSASDSNNNSSYAGARADNDTAYLGTDYAYGNHTYKTSGYEDVIHETYSEDW